MPKNGTLKFQENIRYVNLMFQHFSSTFWEKRTFIKEVAEKLYVSYILHVQ